MLLAKIFLTSIIFLGFAITDIAVAINDATSKSNKGTITINGKVVSGSKGNSFINGSGKKITQARDIKDFEELQIDVVADVKITQGKKAKCVISGDDNIVPIIVTESKGGLLKISTSKSYSTKQNLEIAIEVPVLKKVVLNGSGDIAMANVTKDKLDLKINGSGDITAIGKVKELKAVTDGSGNLKLSGLEASNVQVTIDGAGDAEVWAKTYLKAVINGSGDIIYSGNPSKVDSSVNGSGEVTKK